MRERDSDALSVDHIAAVYEALKGTAKACFRALREHPGLPETEACEEGFRRECKGLLGEIYNLLSRVSLKSHFTDRERMRCMAEVGFLLEPHAGGPIPDSNDLVALALILGVALVLPLSARVGLGFALVIASIMYTAVLTPIVLAHQWPAVAPGPGRGKIAVAFPALSGLIAAALGIGISVRVDSEFVRPRNALRRQAVTSVCRRRTSASAERHHGAG